MLNQSRQHHHGRVLNVDIHRHSREVRCYWGFGSSSGAKTYSCFTNAYCGVLSNLLQIFYTFSVLSAPSLGICPLSPIRPRLTLDCNPKAKGRPDLHVSLLRLVGPMPCPGWILCTGAASKA
ncbi:unnamed protein product [Prunus brigantina]